MVIFASVAAFVVFVALVVLGMFLYRGLTQSNSFPTIRKRQPESNKNTPPSSGILAGSFSKKYYNSAENRKIDKSTKIPTKIKSVSFCKATPTNVPNSPTLEPKTLPDKAQKVIAIKKYTARSPNELNLNIDDQIWLCDQYDNEWGIGYNPVTGLQGAFPLNCCQQSPKLETSPIFNQNVGYPSQQNAVIRIDSFAMLSTSSIYETETSYSADNESMSSKPRVHSMYTSRLNNLIYERT
jgi:hypothetical protein